MSNNPIMKYLRVVFFVEVALDGYAAALDLLNPAAYVAQYTPDKVTGMPLELVRWFGDNLVAILLVELFALLSQRDDFLAWVFRAFLVGDAIQLITYGNYILKNPGAPLTSGFIFSIVVVIVLATARLLWLGQYGRTRKQKSA